MVTKDQGRRTQWTRLTVVSILAASLVSFTTTAFFLLRYQTVACQTAASEMPLSKPQQLSSSHQALARQTSCDLILSPEEYPPAGFCGPRILIIGAMKCGTNQLRSMLNKHRWIVDPRMEDEVHFFTHATKGVGLDPFSLEARRLYAATYPDSAANGTLWTYDKSPSYLDVQEWPDTAARAKQLLPSAKVVAIACEPIARLWSQFYHMLRYDQFSEARFGHIKTIEDLLDSAQVLPGKLNWQRTFIERGFYADHIREWIDSFGKHNVFVVNFAEMTSPEKVTRLRFMKRLLAFLELPFDDVDWEAFKSMQDWERFSNPTANYTRVPSAAFIERLCPYYETENVKLAELLGVDYPRGWNAEDPIATAERTM